MHQGVDKPLSCALGIKGIPASDHLLLDGLQAEAAAQLLEGLLEGVGEDCAGELLNEVNADVVVGEDLSMAELFQGEVAWVAQIY